MLKWYVGCCASNYKAFRASETPTVKSHGEDYYAVIGPFQTKRGALFCARMGYGYPHAQTVGEYEQLARLHEEKA